MLALVACERAASLPSLHQDLTELVAHQPFPAPALRHNLNVEHGLKPGAEQLLLARLATSWTASRELAAHGTDDIAGAPTAPNRANSAAIASELHHPFELRDEDDLLIFVALSAEPSLPAWR